MRNSGTRFFFSLFFFFFTKKNNNKPAVNISHKIKGMHIFFILQGRSRARLLSSFLVRISRRSVTALRTCSPQSRQWNVQGRSKSKKLLTKAKLKGLKSSLFRKKKKNRNERPTTRGIFSWSPIQVLTLPNRA